MAHGSHLQNFVAEFRVSFPGVDAEALGQSVSLVSLLMLLESESMYRNSRAGGIPLQDPVGSVLIMDGQKSWASFDS